MKGSTTLDFSLGLSRTINKVREATRSGEGFSDTVLNREFKPVLVVDIEVI